MGGGDTIYALSSAPGPAGVAVVRLTGARAFDAVQGLTGSVPPPRQASLRTLTDPASGEVIDKALVLAFPGPSSFTGEDSAEFHIHGGRAVREALFDALAGVEGLRLAERGEFTQRAFINGKLDLTEAEGVADLIAAETAAQRRQALAQAEGALSELYAGWRSRLLHQLAHIEAWLDFPDEELPDGVLPGVTRAVTGLCDEIEAHLNDGRRGERLREGITVAITGPPNAGKSTLLNVLAQRDVAIVSGQPGTTRDVLEVPLDLNGYPVILMDTAGLRTSSDQVELEGIRRARDRAGRADIILRLCSVETVGNTEKIDFLDGTGISEVMPVITKVDLQLYSGRSHPKGPEGLTISAHTGFGIPGLLDWLAGKAADLTEAGGRPLPTRARHRAGLRETLKYGRAAVAGAEHKEIELIAEALRQSMTALGRITGHVDVEDLLDVIFRDFCIGK